MWYALDLATPPALRPLPDGYRIIRGTEEDADRISQLDTIGPLAARQRMKEQADFWLVADEQDRSAFACWTFRGQAPVFAAAGGTMQIADDVAVLEDSVTSADHRGRGIAPAAWTAVAGELSQAGVRWMVTKIARENVASRRAIVKAGFNAYAMVEHVRRGPKRTVRAWTDDSEVARQLVHALPASEAPGQPPEPLDGLPAQPGLNAA